VIGSCSSSANQLVQQLQRPQQPAVQLNQASVPQQTMQLQDARLVSLELQIVRTLMMTASTRVKRSGLLLHRLCYSQPHLL
jgi:hypothetical protein